MLCKMLGCWWWVKGVSVSQSATPCLCLMMMLAVRDVGVVKWSDKHSSGCSLRPEIDGLIVTHLRQAASH